jgi:hypothetical protein
MPEMASLRPTVVFTWSTKGFTAVSMKPRADSPRPEA